MDHLLFLFCFCYVFVRVYLLMPCGHLLGKGLTSWLTFVKSNFDVTFPLVSWVRCGGGLYRSWPPFLFCHLSGCIERVERFNNNLIIVSK